MPRRTDLHKILIIGSGPIIISQACEFDYSGTQACKALKEEGFEVILVNSNPATIMTDPEMADKTYIEPITRDIVELIIRRERPDALLPTMGGQTALNVASQLAESGVLEHFGVTMIGANYEAIRKAEDREYFKNAMKKLGLDLPQSGLAHTLDEARAIAARLGFPLIIRPSYTLGGTGGGIAYNTQDFAEIAAAGLQCSMISEILIEESVIGWKEYELEVMRDLKDNVVIICSIENLDPMGIHTGDSITVAPAQTLSDKEYQRMRDAAIAIIREIGVETGGSNIQFAVNPKNGRMVVIEMNPRVSRSSALASKATGFPIAKMAAKLAVGYTLDEIPNDITKETPASFEPTIDYCVVKIPRFTFEKFPETDPTLGISMKSVGETMAIGRTFKEALQKGLRSLEIGRWGLGADGKEPIITDEQEWRAVVRKKLATQNAERIYYVRAAFQMGMSLAEIHDLSKIDPWFLDNIQQIVDTETEIQATVRSLCTAPAPNRESMAWDTAFLWKVKQYGFSDRQLAWLSGLDEDAIRRMRERAGVKAVFKLVDTCAAEFEAYTPYYYSTYERENEVKKSPRKKIMILGGGPNRIGQGIEFDYCCVHASFALRDLGYDTIMVNSNPETVSTDYDTSSRLYFEPLTLEDVLNIVAAEKPDGVIVQFGGQTPLNLAVPLARHNVPIIGTSPDSIDRAEDRKRFTAVLSKLGLRQPPNATATSAEEAISKARDLGFPVLVRPSYVLGGRAMRITYDEETLRRFIQEAITVNPEHPILVDKFLEDAIEVDVDAVADGEHCVIAGIMEHIEQAGIHSGDSACVIPPFSLSDRIQAIIRQHTMALARELTVVGLMNIQFAIKNDVVYILEVNPRASRTVPFVSKVTGIPWAKVAAQVMAGKTLRELGITGEVHMAHCAVKEAVFPFNRFPGVDPILGPEMKSTGEVMGIDEDFGKAFLKSQLAAGQRLPRDGTILISVNDRDKELITASAKQMEALGFTLVGTAGTARYLQAQGITIGSVPKLGEARPNILDLIKNGAISLVINTPSGRESAHDQITIRRSAIQYGIPYVTTVSGAAAAVRGIASLKQGNITVKTIQEYHQNQKGYKDSRVYMDL